VVSFTPIVYVLKNTNFCASVKMLQCPAIDSRYMWKIISVVSIK